MILFYSYKFKFEDSNLDFKVTMFIEVQDRFICSYGDVNNSLDLFLGEFEIDENYNVILYDSLEEGNEELETFLQDMLIEAMNYIQTNYNIQNI